MAERQALEKPGMQLEIIFVRPNEIILYVR